MPTRAQRRRLAIITALALAGLVVASCGSSTTHASNTSTTRTQTTAPPNTSSASSTTSSATTTSTGRPNDPLACVDALPASTKAGQMVMAGLQGNELSGATATFARLGLGGAILMTAPGTLQRADVERFAHAGRLPLLIATDEEGGIVQRLAAATGAIPSAQRVAQTMTPAAAQAMIAAHASKVAALGFNVVFAPVVDVQPPGGGGPIGSRSFSSDPATVTAYGRAYVVGWQSAGIMPVLKHFPGHGSASASTETGPAQVPPLSELRARDLMPFASLAHDGSPLGVMVAHVEVPGLTNGSPASLSPAAYSLLRNDIGFHGLVFTDALGMGAISRVDTSPGDDAVRALAAGADMALFTGYNDAASIVDNVTRAIGNAIPTARADAAVLAVLQAKGVEACSLPSK